MKILISGLLILLLSNLHGYAQSDSKGLKDHYQQYYPIGAAVTPRSLKTDEAALVLKHFNSITAENAMKMGPIHPKENTYSFQGGDSIAAYAGRNGMKMRGHALCWHQQAPAWLFVDSAGKKVSKAVLLQRLKDHITTVVSHYKGKVYAWDVVNEAISDNPAEFYRASPFFEICGEEYIEKAFRWAHEADPDALLFYNDYNEIHEVKRKKIIQLITRLRNAGVPVHGVGLQAHWSIYEPGKEQLEKTLRDFATLGIPLHITELDVSIYHKEPSSRDRNASDSNTTFTKEKEEMQAAKYEMIFEVFRQYKKEITSITFWNISDRRSWLDNFPVRNRKDYPLLFDQKLSPKSAYWKVINFKG